MGRDDGRTQAMGDVVEEVAKRRGRPPATDSAETWLTILRCGRELFAYRGYSAVTNKEIATAAGITTGALYHYVESKLELYVAVHRDVQGRLYSAIRGSDGGGAELVHRQVRSDARGVVRDEPGGSRLAVFTGTVRIDMRTPPELGEQLSRHIARTDRYFLDMIDLGIATGRSIPPTERSPRSSCGSC